MGLPFLVADKSFVHAHLYDLSGSWGGSFPIMGCEGQRESVSDSVGPMVACTMMGKGMACGEI